MGLLLVGVIAGIVIGFAWLAPLGHPQACTFQWQGCFDQIGDSQPATPHSLVLNAPTAQAGSEAKSPAESHTKSHAEAQAALKSAEHSSARHSSAESHRRVALAKEAVQPTRTSERRAAEQADPVLEKAKASVAAKMENPASAEFSDMDRAFRKNTLGRAVDTICGHVRGKDASGGNTGERPFLYLVKEDDAYVVDGKPESAAATAYRNICN